MKLLTKINAIIFAILIMSTFTISAYADLKIKVYVELGKNDIDKQINSYAKMYLRKLDDVEIAYNEKESEFVLVFNAIELNKNNSYVVSMNVFTINRITYFMKEVIVECLRKDNPKYDVDIKSLNPVMYPDYFLSYSYNHLSFGQGLEKQIKVLITKFDINKLEESRKSKYFLNKIIKGNKTK